MQDSKSLYSRCFSEYKLSDDDLKQLQQVLLEILVDVKTVCEKYQINYMLCGGTALGAIRHKGFIPWDDDVDLMMLRDEYSKFKVVFNKELSDKYVLAESLSVPRYYAKHIKIFKKGTTFVEIPLAGVHGPDMIFIDLFILENLPSPGLGRKLKEIVYNVAFRASSVCLDYKYPSPPILQKSKVDQELRKYYTFRRFCGFVFSLFGSCESYLKICNALAESNEETEWVSMPSDRGYLGRLYPRKLFMSFTNAEFCGYMMKIPQDFDTYLATDYGDYMQIPPPEKREVHSAYKIEFSE